MAKTEKMVFIREWTSPCERYHYGYGDKELVVQSLSTDDHYVLCADIGIVFNVPKDYLLTEREFEAFEEVFSGCADLHLETTVPYDSPYYPENTDEKPLDAVKPLTGDTTDAFDFYDD